MKLLFVGDVVGKSGCEMFGRCIYGCKKENGIDITVVNGENSAVGNGISNDSADYLFSHGADVITTGNHCFKRRDSLPMFDSNAFLLRPANFSDEVIGKGLCVLDFGRTSVAIINLMGTVFMEPLDNPFDTVDKLLADIDTKNIFVDFHAEATAEKRAMGFYLASKVTGVFGTHTHVQTNDAQILGEHTGYITDAGMTGPEDSVLGVETALAIEKMRYHCPVKFEEGKTPCFLNGVIAEFDEKLGKCNKITPIVLR